jgi:uroporphyrinogen decarboxylase
VSLQPVRRLGVDAAILFADIMLPLLAIGIELEIVEGIGPVLQRPVRSREDLTALRSPDPDDVAFVAEDIRWTLDALDGSLPLIGFSGAPFTLASYLVEGKPSRDFSQTKRLMYGEPDLWEGLMRRLASIVAGYLRVQAEAGVHVLQLFDSWAGALSLDDYCRFVQPYSKQVFDMLAYLAVPTIHFGTGTGSLLGAMRDAGGCCIGVDWRIPLDVAWQRIGYERGIQGNLDPLVLLGPQTVIEREAGAVLERASGRPGHIFNVGHGIHPETDPNQLARLVEYVHDNRAHLKRSRE